MRKGLRKWRPKGLTKTEWDFFVKLAVVVIVLVIFVYALEQIANFNRPVWTTMTEFAGTYVVADIIMVGIFWLFDKAKLNFYFAYFVYFTGILGVSAIGLFLVGVVQNQIDPFILPRVSAAFWSEMLGLGLFFDLALLRGNSLFPRAMMTRL